MKKLNRKGFTLVELLAVIIILAIVVGISIPAITSVINNSKNSALGIATESAYDYLRDQYDIYNIDATSTDTLISEIMNGADEEGGTADDGTLTITDATRLQKLGFKSTNVAQVTAKIEHDPTTQTADICVTVDKITQAGEYFITTYWNTDGTLKAGNASEGVKNQAGNCS